ncbi:adenylate/guanylate cyclase domain-containing protein [Synechococcales cyanobacterium C]|uniref:Adenylate cyclase n=1 Tax=Petrachloros mirabilis ULC683 TaxID=2781853 RepID=A0A8K2AGQ3_9CYAN|nr:adenylate/guanylate cyclase domain-containing protein [Petrachloros mirabilis]NCJ05029.1 adenylate/guanylate cyclase domain-containing protein [Petrachloros mirabilis ULC683]
MGLSPLSSLTSRLSRRIVTPVFVSLVLFELVLLIPSYTQRQQELLRQLEQVSLEVLATLKVSVQMADSQPTDELAMVAARLSSDSVIVGMALYRPSGQLIQGFGQDPPVTLAQIPEQQVLRSHQGNRYDVVWPSEMFQGQYILAVRHDASHLPGALLAYLARLFGLVVVIAGGMTLVMMLVLSRILITPIVRLRDDLITASDAIGQDANPNFYTVSQTRWDEMGEVAIAFGQLVHRTQLAMRDRREAEAALQEAQKKSERLLLKMFPAPIAEQLKESERAIAARFEGVTILFADLVHFTELSCDLAPAQLVNYLNQIFSAFDALAERYGLEKIKTIGDAYMVVGGLPTPRFDHAQAVLEMAIAMQHTLRAFQQPDGQPFRLRIGINSGTVVAGVIGRKKLSYDLWGDTVNIASRMESQGIPDRIQVTEATYQYLKDQYDFELRAELSVKGRGLMQTYLLVGRKATDLK